jgi:ATP-dependent helicase HrpA
VRALRELDRPSGDVLVFLPGEAEIRDAADAIRGAHRSQTAPVEVLPLYGRLSAAEQHRVFEPSTVAGLRRRVILATNVAETSLTVPGIKYVIDTGTAASRATAAGRMQQLPIEAVSQASANQRSGRAGRTSAASRSASTARRTSTSAPSSPSPRSCAPRSPRWCCRC